MISNAQIKLIKSLHLKKNREEMKLFVAEGKKIVDELLNSANIEVVHVYASGSYFGNKPVSFITEEEMKKISMLTTPPNILAVCKIPPGNTVIPDLKKELSLVLDDIREPRATWVPSSALQTGLASALFFAPPNVWMLTTLKLCRQAWAPLHALRWIIKTCALFCRKAGTSRYPFMAPNLTGPIY